MNDLKRIDIKTKGKGKETGYRRKQSNAQYEMTSLHTPAGSMDAELTTTLDQPGAQYFSANACIQHTHTHT